MRSLVLCLLVLTCVQLRVAWLRLVGPAPLGAPLVSRTAYATESVGNGLVCIPVPRASRSGRDSRSCGAISVERRLLLGVPLDPRHMSVRDWEALPQIGPARARALHAAFASGTSWRQVRGLGARLTEALAARLDVESRSDICSLGSWPTTSSGYDKLH